MATDLAAFQAAPVERVDVGTELTYRRFGQGPAVVLVHGWPLNGATYRGLVRILSKQFTCYVPDLPGAGQTPWDPRTQDALLDWGHLLVRFVDALGLARVALVGHDSGGAIARVAAAELGSRVSLLALIDTEVSNHVPGVVKLYKALTSLPGAGWVFGALSSMRWYRRSQLGFGGCFRNVDHLDGEFAQACLAPLAADNRGALQTLAHVDLSFSERLPDLHRCITAPVVLIWGEDDPFFPVEHARAMLPEFRDVRGFHVLPGQKLFVHDEAPQLVAAHLEPLLQTLHAEPASSRLASA
jgi:pimeloyl-ACP methyl ester carboxylesterase